jgi:hypothetical protein
MAAAQKRFGIEVSLKGCILFVSKLSTKKSVALSGAG